ncbi:DUF3566 domain-containing protein [Thermomonospora umbrina]|uniref:Transmembrane protein DUF3566 n=1 Tax=Thermomonospora umbrina TaxID=111806 RepID=A0A3D9SXJ4_9ACTN|nr:DUF3566 domain-containing protein [Thermomonospora umbrina]REE97284.1 transmembrane protein DUF3566 [Thermomonospora umbrina]
MSTQPNKSTSPRPPDAEPVAGRGANGGRPSDSAKPKPAVPPGVSDATRPEGIAPVGDPAADSGWAGAAAAAAPGSRPGGPSGGSMGGPSMQPPPGPGPGPGGPGGPAGPGGPGAPGGKAKRAVARLGGGTGGKSPRRAQLQLSRLEPWSVMKFSFVMSLVAFVVLLVAVVVLYVILSGLGVFDSITQTVTDLTGDPGDSNVDAASWFSFGRVFGYTILVGALNVLLITALATVGSVIYNLAADLVGGVEVTLKEAE